MAKTLQVVALLLAICTSAASQTTYRTKMTSGPFLVAPTAAAVDWAVVNNSAKAVDLRVTVYKLENVGVKVAVAPGPLTFNLAPGGKAHNANGVGSVFFLGVQYEVVVEATSDEVHPCVTQWSCPGAGCFIPGTLIPAGSFVNIKQARNDGK